MLAEVNRLKLRVFAPLREKQQLKAKEYYDSLPDFDFSLALSPFNCVILAFGVMNEDHIISPFYMDSGIKGFRNCELLKGVTIRLIFRSEQITTFNEIINEYATKKIT